MRTDRQGASLWRLAALCAVLLAALVGASGAARARDEVSVDVFYEELAAHGTWLEHPRYGNVWYPDDVERDWRPYTRGSWQHTEEHGWIWVSDEEWGWATYHYGRWGYDEDEGWFWVPGTEWGPAWVEWRMGEGVIGWSPLPPEVVWANDRFDYGDVDLYAPRYRSHWVFVRDYDFAAPALAALCLPVARNAFYVRRTRPASNYIVIDRSITNRSIPVHRIRSVSRHRFETVRIIDTARPREAYRSFTPGRQIGRPLPIYRPIVRGDWRSRPPQISTERRRPPGTRIERPRESMPGPGGRAPGELIEERNRRGRPPETGTRPPEVGGRTPVIREPRPIDGPRPFIPPREEQRSRGPVDGMRPRPETPAPIVRPPGQGEVPPIERAPRIERGGPPPSITQPQPVPRIERPTPPPTDRVPRIERGGPPPSITQPQPVPRIERPMPPIERAPRIERGGPPPSTTAPQPAPRIERGPPPSAPPRTPGGSGTTPKTEPKKPPAGDGAAPVR